MEARESTAGDRPAEGDEVDRLRQAVEEERQRTLRLLAEFENFRRRAAREREAAGREGRRAALLPLLAVLDPTLHEAVATVPPNGGQPGTVAREVRRGWRLGNDLLRPAQVVVATSSEADDSWR